MRSRFTAYALGNAAYIKDTTDEQGRSWEQDQESWQQSIFDFAKSSVFHGVDILGEQKNPLNQNEHYVTFKATIFQGSVDASFVERSRFRRRGAKWF